MKHVLLRTFSLLFLLFFLGLTSTPTLRAQPCDIPPSTDNCENAPILCNFDDINGYCTSMSPVITGNGPSPLCSQGGAPHNVIWFAFYAGCSSLSITLTPTNCVAVSGQAGIQAAIYGYGGDGLCPSSNQQPAQEVACQSIPCFTSPWTLNAQNLTVGQIYYFMIDGCAGSYCDISIALNGPCGAPAIAPWPAPIQGPTNICTGGTGVYSIQAPTGGIEFYWYLDGSEFQAGPTNSTSITWPSAGTYELCVDVSNQCVDVSENPPQTCITVNVYDVTPENPDPRTICDGTTTSYNGMSYGPGTYEITLKTNPGNCDSVVTLEVIGDPQVDENIGILYLCPNDVVVVGGIQWDYSNQGDNEYIIPKAEFPYCDSTIIFNITGMEAQAYIFPPDQLGCLFSQVTLDGQGSVVVPFEAIEKYEWFAYEGGVLGDPADQKTMTVETPGKYCLRVEAIAPDGSTSCWDSVCVVVTELPVPMATASVSGTITCTNPEVTLTGMSVTPNVQYQWFGPGGPYNYNETVITTTLPGTYSFVVTDASGCPNTATVTVLADTNPPDVSADGGLITCINPNVTLNGGSNTPGVTFAWKNSDGDIIGTTPQTPAPGPGTFTLVVTNPSNGCKDSLNALVLIDTAVPVVSASTDTLTCSLPNPPLNGNSNVPNAVYSWQFGNNPYSGSKDTVATQSGSYTLTVLNPVNGCSKDTTIIVPENTTLPDVQAAGDSLDCVKTTATLVGSSNTPGAQYAWTFNNNPAGNTPSINVSVPGVYTLTVTGPNGCTDSANASAILDADIPDVNITGSDDTINCSVTSILLTGSASMPVTYVWTDANNNTLGSNSTLNISAGGTYTLTVTAANGCSNQTSISIGEDKVPPVIDLTQGGTIDCVTDSIPLNAVSSTPGVTYQWFNAGNVPLSPGATPFVSAPGTYTVVVTGYNGCTASATAVVTSSPDLPQNVTPTASGILTCAQTSVTINVTSTTPGVTVNWTGPNGFSSTNPLNTVLTPGTYFVTVTNPTNGCKVPESIQVERDVRKPQISGVGNQITCFDPTVGISVNLDSVIAGVVYSYQWATPTGNPFPGNSPNIQVSQSGNWRVTVTNTTNGCDSVIVIPVTEDTTQPTITIPQPSTITCASASSTINTTASTTVNYQWSGPGISGANQSVASPTVTQAGTYAVTITNPINGCTNTGTTTVAIDQVNPQVGLTGGTIDCNSPSILINGTSTPNTGIAVQWQLDGSPIPGSNLNLSVNQPGTYTLLVTNTTNGCSAQAQADVLLDTAPPTISVTGGEVTCLIPSISIIATSTTPGVTYQWSGPGGFNSTQNNAAVTLAGNYTAVVTAPNGCTNQAVAIVTEDKNLPTAVASTSNVIDCSNPTTTLSSNGSSTGAGIIYAWTNPGGTLAGTSATLPNVSVIGPYTLTVTNTLNGCSASASVLVVDNQNLPTAIDVEPTNPRCFGRKDGSIVVTSVTGGTPPYLYSLNGGPFTPNGQFAGLGDGSYTVTVQDAAGCLYTSPAFTLIEPLQLTVDLGDDIILQWGRDTFLYALISPPNAIISSIQWTPAGIDTTLNSNEILIKPFNQTLYGVIVTDAAGCRAEDKVLVLVEKRRPVYIPNVFAPSGNQNTRFYVQAGDGIEEIESMEIFNRWGERIFVQNNFQPNDPSFGWDGTMRNQPANPGVFVYYLRVRFNDGITILYKGDVTLMR